MDFRSRLEAVAVIGGRRPGSRQHQTPETTLDNADLPAEAGFARRESHGAGNS
jgi:hypothetical protein